MALVNVQNAQIKYGKLPAKEADEIPWNKLCVDIIGPYIIRRNINKENLNLKTVAMIDPLKWSFEVTQYNDKIAMSKANSVETT